MRWGCWVVGALAVLLCAAAGAEARLCGGAVPCTCGDTVATEAVLGADLRDCRARGLRVVRGGSLDCAGHVVAGTGIGEGIVVDRGDGALVTRCVVADFAVGLRVRSGRDNRLIANEVLGSTRYGIELARSARATLVRDNLVLDSGDEGVHVGTGASGTRIEDNQILGSRAENVYLLAVEGVRVNRNVLGQSGAAAIYVKHSSGNSFEDNLIEDRVVHLRGRSQANFFGGNTLVGAGFVLEAHEESLDAARHPGWTAPFGNRIEGGSVAGARTCFRFAGARANWVSDVMVDDCVVAREQERGGFVAADNVVQTRSHGAAGDL